VTSFAANGTIMPSTRTLSPADRQRHITLYWEQFTQLQGAAICIRLYRDKLARYIFWINFIKVVASSSSVGGWVIWQELPFLWSGIILLVQIADMADAVFPFVKRHQAAVGLTAALETLCCEAETEWEDIHIGKIRPTSIMGRRKKLRLSQQRAERHYFKDGLSFDDGIVNRATIEAKGYLLKFFENDEVEQ
jgi:hypothetical protein